ncbi:hypothetical protein niasHT_028324 [Heterodera trifolii]|uniref:Effector protein n=1 Tax=Heterodera trifolii TaxID=157864 RepID=A0ABD2JMW7_9BILA
MRIVCILPAGGRDPKFSSPSGAIILSTGTAAAVVVVLLSSMDLPPGVKRSTVPFAVHLCAVGQPDDVAVQRQSLSRLKFVDILYAGYESTTENVTPALYVEGVPPLIYGIRVERSAYDAIFFWEPEPMDVRAQLKSHNHRTIPPHHHQ